MKISRVAIIAAFSVGLTVSPIITNYSFLPRTPQSISSIIKTTLPEVVNIEMEKIEKPLVIAPVPGSLLEKPTEPAKPKIIHGRGSGFIIDASGLIVTNNHVVDGADPNKLTVKLYDGTTYKATVIGKCKEIDLAVIKITPKVDVTLKAISWGDSSKEEIGNWVFAVGNAMGLEGTVTQGIVSALNRNIKSGEYDQYIQTDAPINRGNSGGPLFNMNGEVIGVNTLIFSPNGGSIGLGFSIPSNLVKNISGQLVKYHSVLNFPEIVNEEFDLDIE